MTDDNRPEWQKRLKSLRPVTATTTVTGEVELPADVRCTRCRHLKSKHTLPGERCVASAVRCRCHGFTDA